MEDNQKELPVLVTGGAGYIGSIVVRELLRKGYQVRIMDMLNFGFDSIREIMPDRNLQLVPGDIRRPDDVGKCLNDVGAVIHLAAIVGDPACAVQADNAVETNYLSTLRLAMAAKEKGIGKFIFASTCSVYGASGEILTEGSALNPQSLYGETKMFAEKGIIDLANSNFKPVINRLGTLYGLSPRPRFDLVINALTSKILAENKALIFGGEQWRPFLHVADAARSFAFALERYEEMKGQIYNIGENRENYQMKDIGAIFEDIFPKADIKNVTEIKDPRSYRVNFDKLEAFGFRLEKAIKPTIMEIKDAIESRKLDPKNPLYYNYHS